MFHFLFVVHAEGLEPTHLAAPDPKSGAATNYATRAERTLKKDCKGSEIYRRIKTVPWYSCKFSCFSALP